MQQLEHDEHGQRTFFRQTCRDRTQTARDAYPPAATAANSPTAAERRSGIGPRQPLLITTQWQPRHCEERKRRPVRRSSTSEGGSNPFFLCAVRWIASAALAMTN